MIWFNHTGPIQPVGSVVGNTTIDGQNFTVWKGSNSQNNVVSYVATTPINTWNNFDVIGFINNTKTLEPVTNSTVSHQHPSRLRTLERQRRRGSRFLLRQRQLVS